MKNKISVLLILSILILSACGQNTVVNDNTPASGQKAQRYKIGVMGPYTGDAASVGLPIQAAIKIAIDEVNSKGGINGVMLEPIYEDSKCNPKDGNAAAQKLVNVDQVKIIIGGVCSGETLGAAPITEAAKVILISPSATSPDITKAGDFVFRVAPSDAYAGTVASNYASGKLKAQKAAVISESTDYAQGLSRVFKEQFSKAGKIVADEVYNPEDTDFRTQVTKVKASQPDVVYLVPQTPLKGVLLVKQLKEAGIKTQLLTAEVLVGRDVVKENSKDMEGMIGIEQTVDKNAKSDALFAKYKKDAGQDPPFPGYMAGGYDTVYLISDAINKGGYDSGKIRDYLYAVKNYDGAVGKLTIDQNGDPILGYTIEQVKNGQIVPLG